MQMLLQTQTEMAEIEPDDPQVCIVAGYLFLKYGVYKPF